MALDKRFLSEALTEAFRSSASLSDRAATSQLIRPEVCELIASAYHSYVLGVSPGPFTFVTPPVPASFASALPPPFFAGLPAAFVAYWSPVTWVAPGFIPANPTVAAGGAVVIASALPTLLFSAPGVPVRRDSFSEFADDLAEVLHAATLAVVITSTTTSAPPVVAPVPLL